MYNIRKLLAIEESRIRKIRLAIDSIKINPNIRCRVECLTHLTKEEIYVSQKIMTLEDQLYSLTH